MKLLISFYIFLFTIVLSLHAADNITNSVIDNIINEFNQNQQNIIESAKTEFSISDNDFQKIQEKVIWYNEDIKKLFLPNQPIKNFYYDEHISDFAQKVRNIIQNSGMVPQSIRVHTDNKIKFSAQSDLMLDQNNNLFFSIAINTTILHNHAENHRINDETFLSSIIRSELARILWCCNGIVDFLMPHFQKKQHTTESLKATNWFKRYLCWRETVTICYHSTISSYVAFDNLIILLSRYSVIKNNPSLNNLIFILIKKHIDYCQYLWNLDILRLLQTHCPAIIQTYNDVREILNNNYRITV